ncbi:MAG: DinB family protein [Chloroflexi bacterium]|nr:DinB family protein [Chloroflexota bacterium]
MAEDARLLAEKLDREGRKVAAYFSTYDPAQWEQDVYTEGAHWKARDILAHFVSAEQSFLALFQSIVEMGSGLPDGFSIDEFNIRQVGELHSVPPANLLHDFQEARRSMVEWVSGVTDSDLSKQGRHPALGETSLGEMIKMVPLHNLMHLRDLKRLDR